MGREFIELFDEWSTTYDHTVTGNEIEYREVFKNYDHILERVAELSHGHVLEFGSGTGNLTKKLLTLGYEVTAIEPSQAMRKIANEKLNGKVKIVDGDFLNFPKPEYVDSIVSTYAFHHLTNEEKTKAIDTFGRLLKSGGKLVFADTIFTTNDDHKKAIKEAKTEKFFTLAEDLQREYYTTIPFLQQILEINDFQVSFHRCNRFVWIIEALKV
ncbi:SAM-dependent methyltransferase [Bacillus sp. SA1-12]|uniref:class I SAM-dependent methyltransferase n=1 Tax=Bacillus sp. SA1-12 TaxID=1455638 RepID=UPI00062725E2|nr:class I SAM-dependent methyltransferase [Bacillus sp. SA1-12]KKI90340.1 SAM-dependent methyltransferase [Bacillus sp. SA1-12]